MNNEQNSNNADTQQLNIADVRRRFESKNLTVFSGESMSKDFFNGL